MAVQTSLRTVTRRIGDAIRSFVAGMGIDQSHVAIAASLDMENDRIYLVVGSDLPIESRRWHPGIRKAIRKAFEGTPDIDSRLVLVVRNVAALDQIHGEMIVPDGDSDITDLFSSAGTY